MAARSGLGTRLARHMVGVNNLKGLQVTIKNICMQIISHMPKWVHRKQSVGQAET